MTSWTDFNDAKQTTNIIPKGTLAKVRMTIRPGGFDDASQGWTGGYATRGTTSAVYLNVEYTVLDGPYARRKVFSMIGLYSPKGPDWANMGRACVRSILNSARGLSDKDVSPESQNARRINGFADLDGVEFVARIDVGTDTNGDPKNEIRAAVTRDHKEYEALMGAATAATPTYTRAPAYAPAAPQSSNKSSATTPVAPSAGARPTWAQ